MNIAFFTSHIHKSLQWEWLCNGIKKSNQFGNIIHIVFYDDSLNGIPYLVSDLEKHNIKVFPIKISNKLSYFKAISKSCKLLRKYKIDIVHTSLPFGNLFGLISAFLVGIKKRVNTCENASWAYDFRSSKQKLIDKITFILSKKTIAGSDNSCEFLIDKWGLNKKDISLIYHGLEESDYQNISPERINKLKKSLNIKENEFVVGMISRLELWKGHDYAIKAMENIKEKYPNIKLYIFGSSGKDKEEILSLINNLKLNDTVYYKGFVNDPIALLQIFHIHIHVPINKYVENCGISIIEGMVSKRAQILTKSGYSSQSAIHLNNSYVVDYCNSDQISTGIETLYLDKELRKYLAENAYQDAIKDYSNSVKVEKHIALYKSLYQ